MDTNENDYTSPAEEFFTGYGLYMILFRQGIIDETGKHREGDFLLEDGRLLEVKTDTRCYSSTKPTGKIPIEIEHPKHKGRKGWFYHCMIRFVGVTVQNGSEIDRHALFLIAFPSSHH